MQVLIFELSTRVVDLDMKYISRCQLYFIIPFVISAGIAEWLVHADSSPLHEYFLYHGTIPAMWGLLDLPAYLIGAIVGGNPHAISLPAAYIGFVIQWFLVGWLLSLLLCGLIKRLRNFRNILS